MKCNNCGHWLLKKKTIYGDGSEIVNFSSTDGKGYCKVLSIDTTPEFGCLSFMEGEHVEIIYKENAPWQYWRYDICPSCNGRGSPPPPNERHCDRCIGTGRVRYYEDGYIGEERTRLHPNEKEPKAEPDQSIKKITSVSGVL